MVYWTLGDKGQHVERAYPSYPYLTPLVVAILTGVVWALEAVSFLGCRALTSFTREVCSGGAEAGSQHRSVFVEGGMERDAEAVALVFLLLLLLSHQRVR